MISNKPQQTNPASEQLAKAIASKIIAWQSYLATVMNNRVNKLSKTRQKWVLAVFCAMAGSCLILCLIIPDGKAAMNVAAVNYEPSHIGLPSYMPKPIKSNSTDSLTIKK